MQGKLCDNYANFAQFGFSATGRSELEFISQNALIGSFGRKDPNFATQGWYAERDLYDLSSINVPMRSIYLEGDTICEP